MSRTKLRPAASRWLAAAAAVAWLLGARASAVEVKLARHPDFHDGTIVFSYLGDLWTVKEDGSRPRRLTVNKARDVHPRFSPDGKWIAFSSNRYGNYDVFIIPAKGGKPKRLTYHTAADTVVGWTRDSRRVIFSSARGLLYPGIPNLYEVPINGGLEQPVLTDWGYWGSYSPDGKKLAFNRHPMVWWRKHYRGSYAADLWVFDLENNKYRKILDEKTPDDEKANNFWPMYGNDGSIYFVSDRATHAKAGSKEVLASVNNIWKVSDEGGDPVQVTHHKSGSLFFPSLSSDGKTIVYEENFGLWKLDVESGKTAEVKVNIDSDEAENNNETLTVNDEADSFDLSPSGKRAVLSTHGELFTIATESGDVRRVTQTPGARETLPHWSPDGKWLAFAGDAGGKEEVWLCDERGGKLKKISSGDSQKAQLVWSPDSKSLLYSGSDRKLFRYDLDGGKTTTLAAGTVVGFGGAAIMDAQWSPDGKWVSYTRAGNNLLNHVYVIPSGGGPERRVTAKEVYSDSAARWTPDGKRLVYLVGGDVGNIGQAGRSTTQLYTVALTPEEKEPGDKAVDSEEEAAREERAGPGPFAGRGARGDGRGFGRPARRPTRVEVKIDFDRIDRRARRLTRTPDAVGSFAVTPDGQTVAFTTSGVEGGRPVQSIWSVGIDGDNLTRVTESARPEGAGGRGRRGFGGFGGLTALQFTKDGRTLFYKQGSGIYKTALRPGGGGGTETASGRGFGSRMAGRFGGGTPAGSGGRVRFTARVEVDHRAERRQVFLEAWRVMKHRFYAADMHGVDWARLRGVHEPLLDYAGDQEELHEVISMMIGELNASHTGISAGFGRGGADRTETRYPGFDLEADPSGYYKVTHVYRHGPADKDYVKIRTGDFILAVDGKELKAGDNYWQAFTSAPGSRLEFTVNARPQKEGSWSAKVRPVSGAEQANLQYEKWVADRRDTVERLTGGQVGYLHIRQMNEPALRQFEQDLARAYDKKALVIDQRFNPGGGIDQELLQILQQKQYQYTRVRDSVQVRRPLRGFFGPMVVMANERSTSDAEVFPDGFRTLKLGKIVGVTTYGAVIGTGSYRLMDGSVIRTPGSGLWNITGQNLENYGVRPDVYVDNTPEDFFKGRDAQLEKAVEVLQQELRKKG